MLFCSSILSSVSWPLMDSIPSLCSCILKEAFNGRPATHMEEMVSEHCSKKSISIKPPILFFLASGEGAKRGFSGMGVVSMQEAGICS